LRVVFGGCPTVCFVASRHILTTVPLGLDPRKANERTELVSRESLVRNCLAGFLSKRWRPLRARRLVP
jgi:hypothetical protein